MPSSQVEVTCPCGCDIRHMMWPKKGRVGYIKEHYLRKRNPLKGRLGINAPAFKGFGSIHYHSSKNRWYIKCRNGSATPYARAVAEKILKRELPPHEIVHHINKDSSDDRPSNLLICGRDYHNWLHDIKPFVAAGTRGLEKWQREKR